MKNAKRFAIAAATFFIGMFTFWLAGGEFTRGSDLAISFCLSCVISYLSLMVIN